MTVRKCPLLSCLDYKNTQKTESSLRWIEEAVGCSQEEAMAFHPLFRVWPFRTCRFKILLPLDVVGHPSD